VFLIVIPFAFVFLDKKLENKIDEYFKNRIKDSSRDRIDENKWLIKLLIKDKKNIPFHIALVDIITNHTVIKLDAILFDYFYEATPNLELLVDSNKHLEKVEGYKPFTRAI
jgi:hypothetical protein